MTRQIMNVIVDKVADTDNQQLRYISSWYFGGEVNLIDLDNCQL